MNNEDNGLTLGEILQRAIHDSAPEREHRTIPFETVHVWADLVRLREKKIDMITVLRRVTNIDLRDAKNCVECEDGFIMPWPLYNILRDSTPEPYFVRSNPYPKPLSPYRIFC